MWHQPISFLSRKCFACPKCYINAKTQNSPTIPSWDITDQTYLQLYWPTTILAGMSLHHIIRHNKNKRIFNKHFLNNFKSTISGTFWATLHMH